MDWYLDGRQTEAVSELRHEIDGYLRLQRIVLGNRACPFGDAVHRAPGLCRMTSSVFGGIAARNTGTSSVVLEQRIAVGDPECRIVVTLGRRADGGPAAHHYGEQPEHAEAAEHKQT